MKKIIAIILAAASLSALHIDTFAEEHSYDTRAEMVLEAVGLDTSFSTGASISRGRFVAAIADFMGLGHSDQTPFYDVGVGSEYFGQICAAYTAGLISGKADKMFYPNENITYNEAISICITATGRKMYAVAHGGYPVGFNYTADSEELGKNVAARGDTPISGEDAVWLLFNTFSCEIIGQESFGADIELAGSGETMFSFYKDIEVTEGIVKANRLSGLYSAEDMLADRAKIGDLVMGDENGFCDELLGLYVEVYYTENDSEQSEIKACFPVEKENSITEIDAADCISFEDNIFTYEIHGRQKKERIDASVPVIYNRTAAPEREDRLFTPKMGYVQLLDNNRDNMIDAVKVIDRTDYIVFAYDKLTDILYDKNNKSLDLSEDNDKFVTIKSMSGNIMSGADLEEKMVVTAEVSIDKNVIYAVVSTEKRYGSVTMTEFDEDGARVTLSDEVLYISPSIVDNIPQGISSKSGGTFYLNAYGYIADFEQTDEEFVYVISMYRLEAEQDLQMRYMTRGGEIAVSDFRDKYTLNGTSVYEKDGIPTVIERGDVALVSKNSDGEITKISTPDNNSGIYSFGDMSTLTYSDSIYSFNGKFTVGADTVIMSCPMPDLPYDEDEYSIVDIGELADGESYTARAFVTAKNSIIPKVIVLYSGAVDSIKRSDDCVLIRKILDTVNEDSEPVKRIYFYRRDKEAYVDCVDIDMITNAGVGVGDIIKFSTNRKGYMINVDKIYSAKTNDFNSSSSFAKDNGTRNSFRLVGGQLYNREDNVIGIYDGNPAGISHTAAEYFTIPENVTGSIYVVDTDSGEIVKKGGMYSLKDYCHFGETSKVLIYTRYATMLMMVVYE